MTPPKSDCPSTIGVDLDRAVLALTDALDFIGVDEIGHGHRVGLMAAVCAQVLNWSPPHVHRVLRAGLLHDCGVSSTREHRHLVDEMVWDGQLAHCQRGAAYLSAVPALTPLAPLVFDHHTPWEALVLKPINRDIALAANLIYLVDRADAVHACGVAEGKPVIDVLSRYEGTHFAPELMAVFRQEAQREAFWFAQEDPTLRERVSELMVGGPAIVLQMMEIKALARMFGRIIDAKSPYTERHSLGVAKVALRLGRHFGLSDMGMDMLEIAALLHDLGKLRIPDELLEKQGPLSAEERRRMARHAFDTYEVLHRIFGDSPIADWAALHHEYVSGQGYPFRRDDGSLPLEARLIAAADVMQALAQRRPYRDAMTPEEILALMDGMVFAGKLDGSVVQAIHADVRAYWQDAVVNEISPATKSEASAAA